MKKKVVAFVPLKLNNERLPGKNTKVFDDGVPLVDLILRTLLQVQGVDELYVYCSNEGIIEYLPDRVRYLKRSSDLDRSETKINEVLQSFARDIPASVYVLVHATAPFISVENIEHGVRQVVSGKYDSALAVHKIQEFIWQNGKPINYELSAVPRTQDLLPIYIETTGLYVYTHELIADRNVRIGDRPFLIEVSKIESVDINDLVDFEIANALYMKLFSKENINA